MKRKPGGQPGRIFSKETREKIRQALLGKKLSLAHRKALSLSKIGKPGNNPKGHIGFWAGKKNPHTTGEKSHFWIDGRNSHRKEKWAKWRDEHREEYREYLRNWKRKNKDRVRASNLNSLLKRKGVIGSFSNFEWWCLMAGYDFKCAFCGDTEKELTRDHIVPISKGGTNYIDNIQPLCGSCNYTKQDRSMEEFRLYMAQKNINQLTKGDEPKEEKCRHCFHCPKT